MRQPHSKIECFVYLFLAWGVDGQVATSHDAGEKIVVNMMSFDETRKMIEENIGYLGEARNIFEKIRSIEHLYEMPEFNGTIINR